MVFMFPSPLWAAFGAGLVLSLSTIMALGPQNVHVMRMGLMRQHVALTVLVCTLSDLLLIAASVFGVSQFLAHQERLHGALIGAGAVFLFAYGWQAAQRCWRPAPAAGASAGQVAGPMTRRQAVLSALGFSLLNPHAWLDTAVIIGSASLVWGQSGGPWFGLGAAAGSGLWFVCLALLVTWAGQRLGGLWVWRALDGFVALMMWGIALWLLVGLV
jgi:L-lysine exporter family protein LysE/ArgO